ncbi:MAG: hypothetical protein DMG39_23130 [Acidobacteria bacterium]|nr:MAG: hypothetical protein DMG39_23130 [Acidobacteriota bacterium]
MLACSGKPLKCITITGDNLNNATDISAAVIQESLAKWFEALRTARAEESGEREQVGKQEVEDRWREQWPQAHA